MALCMVLSSAACSKAPKGVLRAGMSLPEVREKILAAGGKVVDGAYPLFWSQAKVEESNSSPRNGAHEFFTLSDGFCVAVRYEIKTEAGTENHVVLSFALDHIARGYPGKVEWSSARSAGTIKASETLDLSAH
jgi:hypothetical protein